MSFLRQVLIAVSVVGLSTTGVNLVQANESGGKGGQVIESGPYHLEFVAEKETKGTHLDFYLQDGQKHQPIPNAKVTAQLQLPSGTRKFLTFKYDASGKHYTVLLPETAKGTYKIVIISDIGGKKVNGRFNFTR